MVQKKPFKYYAIRVANTIIFRRTVNQLFMVRSMLYKPRSEFKLEQISYTGGIIIGSMPYIEWLNHGKREIRVNGCTRIQREDYRALDPYITKERVKSVARSRSHLSHTEG